MKRFILNLGIRSPSLIVERCETPVIEIVDEIVSTERGERGFGSSG